MAGPLCWTLRGTALADACQNTANERFVSIVSGGFAIVQPDSQLSINAVEGFSLEDFSADVYLVLTSHFSLNQTKIVDITGCAISDNRSTKDCWRQRK